MSGYINTIADLEAQRDEMIRQGNFERAAELSQKMESLKEEVDNLNGTIEIQSKKDEGTVFIIKVPYKEAS